MISDFKKVTYFRNFVFETVLRKKVHKKYEFEKKFMNFKKFTNFNKVHKFKNEK